ncbi:MULTISPECIES: DUF4407 domain-containing protein [Bacteria]|jgi:hypothetical protein|uniref:DUF4407 domain-containing protein n=1 Tax=Merismopedia glauca CCAP 1448/3 TaxID=1296344 RepID=A0A2T1C626_9CYAN|nr:DUF4407 domain-containing protein [Merismopedia glauca]PSB03593.1 hypothetical protein C7B64_07570 [Merismopedia glauca CCAP 1448/3]
MAAVETSDPKDLDKYDYKCEAGKIRQFLWFCAGIDEQLIRRCPHSERVKAEGIGGVILATSVLAFLSGSYAFYTVFGPKISYALTPEQQVSDPMSVLWAIVCGIAWALVIFNLDRFIVTSTGHGDGTEKITWDELINGLPRIVMAVFIGICISAPLEIRVFQSEINAELEVRQTEQTKKYDEGSNAGFAMREADLNGRKQEKREELQKKESRLNGGLLDIKNQRKTLEDEAGGNTKTGTAGRGPAWRDKMANLEKMEAELQEEKPRLEQDISHLKTDIAQLQTELTQLSEEKTKAHMENTRRAVNIDGLGNRINIAHELFPTSSKLLMLLLIIIEVTPIFIKMMFIRGPYDLLSENQNRIVTAKFGIEEYPLIQAGQNLSPIGAVSPNFHQAKIIEEYEVATLAAERELSKTAQEAYLRKMKRDIQANPEKYFTENS